MVAWMPPQQWMESLDGPTRAKADRMMALLESLGARDPLVWVQSDMTENIPQVARFLFLHRVRQELIGSFAYADALPEDSVRPLAPDVIEAAGESAYGRLLETGTDARDIERVARAAACRAIHDFIDFLDGLISSDVNKIEDAPRWILAEVSGPAGELTGRCLDGLHESVRHLYTTDP